MDICQSAQHPWALRQEDLKHQAHPDCTVRPFLKNSGKRRLADRFCQACFCPSSSKPLMNTQTHVCVVFFCMCGSLSPNTLLFFSLFLPLCPPHRHSFSTFCCADAFYPRIHMESRKHSYPRCLTVGIKPGDPTKGTKILTQESLCSRDWKRLCCALIWIVKNNPTQPACMLHVCGTCVCMCADMRVIFRIPFQNDGNSSWLTSFCVHNEK